MTQNTEQQSYRGVKCLHCKQPIAISPLVARIEAELRDDKIAPAGHQKCQVFHLRCVACSKEKPYRIGEILEFQGAPSSLALHAEPTSAYLRRLGNMTRVSNA